MSKFKLFIVFFCFFYACFSCASDCAGVTVERAFKENKLVVFVDAISVRLVREQFIDNYMLKRKGMVGFNQDFYLERANKAWDEYEKRPSFASFFVRGALKEEESYDSFIDVINTPEVQFQIGKTYILFLSKPYKNQDVFVLDSCIYFNFTDKKYFQDDQGFSRSGTFEGALDDLFFYRKEYVDGFLTGKVLSESSKKSHQ